MKLLLPAGSTSVICHVFALDASETTGAGKTALAFGDITAYYVRAGGALTALTMVDITTLGTWDTDVIDDKLGFKLLHDTNAPGVYEVHLPNNILATGANQVTIQLRATDMAPVLIEIQLAGVDVAQISNDATAANNLESACDNYSATRGLAGTALPAAAADAAGGLPISDAGGLDLDAKVGALTFTVAGDVDVNLQSIAGAALNTATAQIGANVVTQANIDFGALQKASLNAATPASVVGAVGSVTGAVGSVTGAVGSVTAGVTVTTNNDKTGYALSAAGVQAVWDALNSALTTVGSIGKRLVDYLTGDVYARVGAPAGASLAADVAAVKAETAAIVADTNELQTDDYPTSIAAVKADTAAILLDTGTDGVVVAAASVRTAVGLAAANLDTQLDALPTAAENADATWDEALAGHAVAGSAGAALSAASAPTAAAVADAVWDELTAGHAIGGSTGAALSAAGGAADPLLNAVPGSYVAGTAGYVIGTNLNAPVGDVPTAAEVWAAATRTLTSTAAATTAAVSGSTLTITKSVSYAATLSGLTIPATWAKILLTAKEYASDGDAASQLQIQKSTAGTGDGLLYINKQTPTTAGLVAADASLTVTQAAGTIAIVVDDEATAVMLAGTYSYDVKCLLADGTSQQLSAAATLTVAEPITKTI